MAKIAKTSQLTLTPKALQKALEQSAQQAQKLADAFGVKVPFTKPTKSKTATTRFTLDATPLSAAQTKALQQRVAKADAHAINYSDVPELGDEWFLRAAREGSLATQPVKKPISIKLDADVLDYFKSEGSRYQTHINAVLRAYMQAQHLVRSN